mmetsp:Transcript_3152/g.6521  ORF Transcript_3152/g.6521 Transcript_3152/m.6521 type:complete len:98 (-) Transcript_3152:46-339(-)
MFSIGVCYEACNSHYSAVDPNRLYCKKACDSDEDFKACKNDFCQGMCVKQELGEEDQKQAGWTKWFARAPGAQTSEACLAACYYGCSQKEEDAEDDK